MQITALNSTSFVTAPNTSYKAVNYGTDKAQLGMSADDLNQYIQQAKQVPEVRDNLVQHFQDQIKSGFYPPPSIMNGLTKLIGGGFMPLDKVMATPEPTIGPDATKASAG